MRLSLKVLVTRPKPAGKKLCEAIEAAGGRSIYFPTLNIVPCTETVDFQQSIARLDQYDWLIFISPQAVYTSVPALLKKWPVLPSHLKVAAIGEGTANALRETNIPVTAFPKEHWNSEGLLALPEFQMVADQKIALVRGEEGRDYLAKTLSHRGAIVTHLIAYQRELPKVGVTDVIDVVVSGGIDMIVCTSGEGLSNLKKLLASAFSSLRKIPVIVISERMVTLAQEIGFEKIFLAKNASQDAIMDTLSQHGQKGLNMTKTTAEVVQAQPEKQHYFPWSGIGIFISILVLIALLVAAYLGERRFMLVDASINHINTDLDNKLSQHQDTITALQKNLSEAEQNIVSIQQAINDLRNAAHSNKDAWSVSEAQYLTKLANDNLQIGDNLPLVLRLLQTADQELSTLSDPKVAPIRKALAADIAALQAVPSVDASGIYMQLSALNAEVDQLPLANNRPVNEASQANNTSSQSWWRRGLKESWKTLQQIVVVRYHQSGQHPFIAPEQQQFLYQNIHAMFEQAMSAITQKQPMIYQESLHTADSWIKQYFIQDSPLTMALLKSLNQLQTVAIKPELPNISATLQTFRDYLAADDSHPDSATDTSQNK
ncbi:MAG: uroporphyrinogen-III C-methyltransferase [Gammaproteobacteria bacterium]|nr:uroporphyrinogen-III C-methyltransferase [Gammaproteobacteria bacterium]